MDNFLIKLIIAGMFTLLICSIPSLIYAYEKVTDNLEYEEEIVPCYDKWNHKLLEVECIAKTPISFGAKSLIWTPVFVAIGLGFLVCSEFILLKKEIFK